MPTRSLVTLALLVLAGALGRAAHGAALTSLLTVHGYEAAGRILTATSAIYVFAPLAGGLAALVFRPRTVLVVGLALVACGVAGAALAPELTWISALGAGAIAPATAAVLAEIAQRDLTRPRAASVVATVAALLVFETVLSRPLRGVVGLLASFLVAMAGAWLVTAALAATAASGVALALVVRARDPGDDAAERGARRNGEGVYRRPAVLDGDPAPSLVPARASARGALLVGGAAVLVAAAISPSFSPRMADLTLASAAGLLAGIVGTAATLAFLAVAATRPRALAPLAAWGAASAAWSALVVLTAMVSRAPVSGLALAVAVALFGPLQASVPVAYVAACVPRRAAPLAVGALIAATGAVSAFVTWATFEVGPLGFGLGSVGFLAGAIFVGLGTRFHAKHFEAVL